MGGRESLSTGIYLLRRFPWALALSDGSHLECELALLLAKESPQQCCESCLPGNLLGVFHCPFPHSANTFSPLAILQPTPSGVAEMSFPPGSLPALNSGVHQSLAEAVRCDWLLCRILGALRMLYTFYRKDLPLKQDCKLLEDRDCVCSLYLCGTLHIAVVNSWKVRACPMC